MPTGPGGLFPAFFPLLKPAGGALEVLAHRVVWTLVLMAGVVVAMRKLSHLRSITGRTWLLLLCASALVSANWVIFIFAVSNGHVVDAALGYFINPLISVLLGVLIFRERLNRAQVVAVLIALAAVILLGVEVGGPPIIALGLASTFGLYGVVKKVVPTIRGSAWVWRPRSPRHSPSRTSSCCSSVGTASSPATGRVTWR